MTKKTVTNKLVETIVDSIDDIKGEDITILDLKEIDNAVSEYFIICSGNSNTQVAAIAANIEKKVRNLVKERPINVEGAEVAKWVLLDYGNVVVHVFQKPVREYYNLESMWGDAKNISA
ncbi:MAG: ribosome silencing factor [Flavobacteriaceae bacterium]|nr:ribosome silencing factor [Flavobacteriaceae bacterium]